MATECTRAPAVDVTWTRGLEMGDKGKGKNAGKDKKPKAVKALDGNRPHEQRQREDVVKRVGQ